ncbi:hypothetical protein M8J76_009642 [Diaphorina citri]|nr:hypothetical protein M8J75_008024 [Diaphorina citri]KAI5749726.1 hypothetical protein M8J76_009642 [Diaphorina citri]
MKRRNGDCAKLRRQVRKTNRSLDDTYDSMVFITKTLAFWMMTFTVDHFLHFRLEFFWPLWYLARNINASYKYQGLGLSFVFVCIAFTSDVLCYFFIPVQYLFFAASTWVWVHYIYNNERGLTASTLILYFIIILLESSVKFKPEHRHALNINLCKPFAAHCIGFPIVTFSFSEIRNCYFSFVSVGCNKGTRKSSQDLFSSFDGEVAHKNYHHRKSTESQDKDLPYSRCHKLSNVEDFTSESNSRCSGGRSETNSSTTRKSKSQNNSHHSSKDDFSSQYKQQAEFTLGLERDIKQLRASLSTSRSIELELRSTLANLTVGERNARSELSESLQENQELNARLQSLLTARALDKQALSSLEKRLVEEKKAKSTLETLLARERKARRAAEESAAKLSSVGCGDALCRGKRREVEAAKVTNGGCADAVCRGKRRELEVESRQWKREADERRERCAAAENELQALQKLREEQSELEHRLSSLRSEVSSVQDRNVALERSLSAETRIKLDLFSALGEAKRENEIVEGKLRKSERELNTIKARMAQVLAVMPPSSFGPLSHSPSATSKLLDPHLLPSNLDPNAIAYTPKTNGHLIMEA